MSDERITALEERLAQAEFRIALLEARPLPPAPPLPLYEPLSISADARRLYVLDVQGLGSERRESHVHGVSTVMNPGPRDSRADSYGTRTFSSQQAREKSELSERRACAHVDAPMRRREASSLGELATRLSAVFRAWDARQESAVRDELHRLAEEAELLAATETLWRR